MVTRLTRYFLDVSVVVVIVYYVTNHQRWIPSKIIKKKKLKIFPKITLYAAWVSL